MFNHQMLPGNIDEGDEILISELITAPIAYVPKNPPRLLEKEVTSLPTPEEDEKEMSAIDFPKLRGFV